MLQCDVLGSASHKTDILHFQIPGLLSRDVKVLFRHVDTRDLRAGELLSDLERENAGPASLIHDTP